MAERDDEHGGDDSGEWSSSAHTDLMTRYEQIAAESASAPSKDGKSVVAEFSLGGSVPRTEENRGRYQSTDVYVRLENTIYGPVTQDELVGLLASGQLTGFESASADLQHWTPLIYHPRMTLSGDIDPDATHDLLHERSTLPAASRAPNKVDLEAIADLDDDEEVPMPSTPLAAILIKPIRVSRKTGLPLPVHADLESESLENVQERTEISEQQKLAGQQAVDAVANKARELIDAGELKLIEPPPLPPEATGEHAPVPDRIPVTQPMAAQPGTPRDTRTPLDDALDAIPPSASQSAPVVASAPQAAAPRRSSAILGVVVTLLVLAAAAVAAWTLQKQSQPASPEPPPVEAPAAE